VHDPHPVRGEHLDPGPHSRGVGVAQVADWHDATAVGRVAARSAVLGATASVVVVGAHAGVDGQLLGRGRHPAVGVGAQWRAFQPNNNRIGLRREEKQAVVMICGGPRPHVVVEQDATPPAAYISHASNS